jgi:hypothetical protein
MSSRSEVDVSNQASQPLYGTRGKGFYENVGLDKIVGQTVWAVELTTVDGAFGPEPCLMLYFKNWTKHGFVIRGEE